MSSLVEQATTILAAATSLQQRLEALALPQPTFDDPGGRQDWHDAAAHPDVLRLRSALVDASRAMHQLALGPVDALAALAGPGAAHLEVARTLDALGVAQAVPLDDRDGIALPVLAASLGVDAHLLHRQLRFAYLVGLFREPRDGFVAHTAASAALPGVGPWLRLRQSAPLTKGVDKIPEALAAVPSAKEEESAQVMVRKTATQLADPKGRGMWAILDEDYHPPGEGMRFFSAGMKSMMSGLLGASLAPYVHGFDWASLAGDHGKTVTVVDVGGGNGHVGATLLPQIPAGVRFVVQDLAANEAPARALLARHGAEAQARIAFRAHDFFRPQPAADRDDDDAPPGAYLLSRVLHDWRDDECVAILRHLVPAMDRHGTLLWLCERVLPESDRPGRLPNHVEQQLRAPDLLMFTLFGGGERTLSDWERVLAATDPRLRIRARNQPLDSVFSFIEVVLDGASSVPIS